MPPRNRKNHRIPPIPVVVSDSLMAQLRELAIGGTIGQRSRLAEHTNTPHNVLGLLADDPMSAIRIRVARNAKTPVDMLRKLASDTSHIQNELLENPATPSDVIESIYGKTLGTYGNIRYQLFAVHANTPEVILGEIMYAKRAEVLDILTNSSLSAAMLNEIMTFRSDAKALTLIAEHDNATPEQLAVLSDSVFMTVRAGVAKNHATPAESLTKLLPEASETMQCSLAANRNSPATLLDQLSTSKNRNVRANVARNPSISAKAALMLLVEENSVITKLLCRNDGLPKSLRDIVEIQRHYQNNTRMGYVPSKRLLELISIGKNETINQTKENDA